MRKEALEGFEHRNHVTELGFSNIISYCVNRMQRSWVSRKETVRSHCNNPGGKDLIVPVGVVMVQGEIWPY